MRDLIVWFREMTQSERRTFWACFSGWAVDAMDVQLYSFAIPSLIAQWGLSKTEAGLLGTVALLMSAVGGWLAGILADRMGRVRTLQLTILWFAGFSFLSGLSQNYEQLLVCRALMGLGFGGEWAAGAVLMGESIRAKHRGKAVGCVQSGWSLGWAIAAGLFTLLFSVLPPQYAWRALFFVGLIPAGLALMMRKFVDEPQVFRETQRELERRGDRPSFWEIFSPDLLKTTVLASLLATGAQGGYYAITTWLPTYLSTTRGLSITNTGAYLGMTILGSFVGYLTGAYITDALGRRANFFIFAVGSAITVLVFGYLPVNNAALFFLGFPLGFFPSGTFSGMGAYFTELFPSRVRGSGQGFSYNFGRGIGALFPSLVGHLSAQFSLGHAIAGFAAVSYLLMTIAAAALPETKGQELR
jgi:MFS family permease